MSRAFPMKMFLSQCLFVGAFCMIDSQKRSALREQRLLFQGNQRQKDRRMIALPVSPAKLADGLGPGSGPCERLPAPFAPSLSFPREFGSPARAARKWGRDSAAMDE